MTSEINDIKKNRLNGVYMPTEIYSEEEFLNLAKISEHCRVKRSGEVVKLKLRGKNYLYVLKTSPKNADALIKKIDCEVIEL